MECAAGERARFPAKGRGSERISLIASGSCCPWTRTRIPLFVEERPRLRSVESPHRHARDQRWIEIAEVHAVPRAGRRRQRLPVRHAAAGSAMDGAQRAVAMCIRRGVFGMAFDFDGAELEVDPRPADAAAQRAVALRRASRRRREAQADGAAVTGSLVHGECERRAVLYLGSRGRGWQVPRFSCGNALGRLLTIRQVRSTRHTLEPERSCFGRSSTEQPGKCRLTNRRSFRSAGLPMAPTMHASTGAHVQCLQTPTARNRCRRRSDLPTTCRPLRRFGPARERAR